MSRVRPCLLLELAQVSPIFELGREKIRPIRRTSFGDAGVSERGDLQRLLRDQIDVVAPDVLVIGEEFGEWTDSRRRIDLLGVDLEANLVVIELKRTDDGGHMELQALRYASMVSTLTAVRAVEVFDRYLKNRGRNEDAEQALLEHLGWEELDDENFGQDVRIVLVSADFSRELTTAVMWLNEKELDIRCVRVLPYQNAGSTLIDVQQIIPLPEVGDYQVQVREKRRQERQSRQTNADFTRYDVRVGGRMYPSQWKRNAILLVVKSLHEIGVPLTEIHELFMDLGRGNAFMIVEGNVPSVDRFRALATEVADTGGRAFRERNWHLKEGNLMVQGGRTWAFTNQWGRYWSSFMQALQARYPQIDLSYEPATEAEAA